MLYSREIWCEGLWCDWNEAERGDACLEAGGGWETHYHTALQTSHTSSPLTHLSQQLQHQSFVFFVFFSVLCFFKLWCVCMSSTVVWLKAPPVVFWEGERCAQAYCYSSRCLCVWSALIAELCFWCSCFALVSTWLHIHGLFAAGSSTMSSVVQNNYFYCCCLDLPHKRHDYKNIDVNQILCS